MEDGKNNKWFSLPAFDPSIKEAASLIDPKSFKHKSVSTVAYTGTKTKQTIKLDDTRCYKSCSCSCYNFNKWGICSHVVAYSYTNALDWYGSQYRQPENFVPNTKKGAKVKRLKNTGRFGLAESALVHSRQN